MTKKLVSLILALTVLFACQAAPAFAEDIQEPELKCKAALLVDTKTDQVIYEKNSHKKMVPASLTKMMTCLLVMENLDLDKQVKIPAQATGYHGSAIGLKKNEVFTVRELLYALMLPSANDAAVALAIEISGSHLKFVEKMNAKAEEMDLENTFYFNANGYTNDKGHHTTAADLYTIAKELMKYPEVKEITKTRVYKLHETTESGARRLENTNELLGKKKHYDGIYGIKTGYMGASGYCFVGGAERDGMDLICVVLNCETREDSFEDTVKLFDYGFNNFYTKKLMDKGDKTGNVIVRNGHHTFVPTETKDGAYITLPTQADESVATSKVVFDQGVKAPLKKGTRVGVVEMYQDGEKVGESEVIVSKSVAKGGPWSALYISDIMFYAGIVVLAALLILLITINVRRRKRKEAREARIAEKQAEYERIMKAEKEDKEKRNWPF